LAELYSGIWRITGLARRMPVTSRDWREPPIWELIAAAPGENAASVFNWWATYPARGTEGLFIFTDVAQAAVARGDTPPRGSLYPALGEEVAPRKPRLLLQLFNGRERARRLGAEVPPVTVVDRALAEALANWRLMDGAGDVGDVDNDAVVMLILKPESGNAGELWLSRLNGGPLTSEKRGLSLYDAAAMLFAFCGVPLAEDLPGEPPQTSSLGELPPRIDSYGEYRMPSLDPHSISDAMESLRSLGYLQ